MATSLISLIWSYRKTKLRRISSIISSLRKSQHYDTEKTDVITKISYTVHTAGIDSFSMYRHLTRPVDGIPKANTETRFKAFRLIHKPHREKIFDTSNLENWMMLNITDFSCFCDSFSHSPDSDWLLTADQHLPPHHPPQHYLLLPN